MLKRKNLHLFSVFAILLIITAGCSKKVSTNKIPADAPDYCKQQYLNFPTDFPVEVIYANSIKLQGSKFRKEKDVKYDGWLGSFCVKSDSDKILQWFKNKYGSQGFKYYNMETVHYWTKKDEKKVMLDLIKKLGNGYVLYSVDIRDYN